MSSTSPTSPRHVSIQIDPHLPLPPHRQVIASPGGLSPVRAIGPGSLQGTPSMLRGNSSGRTWDEAQARERQRLQDIDSAKSMCELFKLTYTWVILLMFSTGKIRIYDG